MMIQKIKFFIAGLSILLLSCNKTDSKVLVNSDDKFNSPLDSLHYKNYVNAVQNNSTFQYFVVIKIKNMNSGEIREICTQGNFLRGALYREYKLSYTKESESRIEKLLLDNKSRYFQFKDTSAINNLGVKAYSIKDLELFEKKNNVDSIEVEIKKKKWESFISDDKRMLLLAHSLFNRGILTGENNCIGGTLIHVDDDFLKERKELIERLVKKNKK